MRSHPQNGDPLSAVAPGLSTPVAFVNDPGVALTVCPRRSTAGSASMGGMDITKDGQSWRIGTADDVAWLADRTTDGYSVTSTIPPVFEAYATYYPRGDVSSEAYERAVIDELVAHTQDQPWWLGYLETGAHDIVFPLAPRVSLYAGWPYVLVEAGPAQALTWRTGHMRGDGPLPDLFFPADRSWLVSALWDDGWTCIGGHAHLITALHHDPVVQARPVDPDEDALPPGLTRE